METFVYYVFCAMCLGGAIGVLSVRGFVNAAMSMLVSMLGVAGLMLMMGAYFIAFLMVTVYAGAVLVLFVFVVMLVGDKTDGVGLGKKLSLVGLWAILGLCIAYFEPQFAASALEGSKTVVENAKPVLAESKNYGFTLFTTFILPFEIAGILLLAAMVGVIVIAKEPTIKKSRIDMQ